MPRTPRVAELKPSRVCEAPDCRVAFTPQRSTARYHSGTCQRRAARARKAAEAAVEIDRQAAAEGDTGTAEHGLVTATQLTLEKAGALHTVEGQVAMVMARRLTDPTLTGFATASKDLLAIVRDAIGAAAPEPSGPEAPEAADDEVTRARSAREEARQAAGRT